MKRWFYSLLLAVGVVFFLWIPHRPPDPRVHPQDRSALSQSTVVSTWCQDLGAATPAFLRSRAGPLEIFLIQYGSLIADDDSSWLDRRGPPGANACRQTSVTNCKAAGPAGSPRGQTLRGNSTPPEGQFKPWGFATRFS